MLLPHWTLFINTVSWGDLCVEDSLAFKLIGYELMGFIGYITCASLVTAIVILFLLLIFSADPNGPVFFIYGCLCCLFLFYLVTVAIVNLYCSPYIVRILFYAKFCAMALH